MEDAIGAVRSAFADYAEGSALNQPRRRLSLPTGAVLHSMAGAYRGYFGSKVYSTHARHGAHFTFLFYDAATAAPLAQFEANYLGQIRTGAVSGVAADILAPDREIVVAVIGSGFQARTQLEAVAAVRAIKEARVWSRDAAKRHSYAELK
jgi:ornithine cyclodeaminase/alanine dehydrogenase-like protein (mu-crystallin family)